MELVMLGGGLVALVVVCGLALWTVRLVHRVVGTCLSLGVGCLVLIFGGLIIVLLLAAGFEISSLEELVRLLGA